jgi:hypothetical protein
MVAPSALSRLPPDAAVVVDRAAVASATGIGLCWNRMHINPKGMIGGSPALVVRKAVRYLRDWNRWKVVDLEAAAALAPGTGDALAKALRTEGLIEASGTGAGLIGLLQVIVDVRTLAMPNSQRSMKSLFDLN